MLRPTGEDGPGSRLLDRHAAAFRDRERDGLSDAHRDVDPDVVAGALRACPASMPIDLTDRVAFRRGRVVRSRMYDSAPARSGTSRSRR